MRQKIATIADMLAHLVLVLGIVCVPLFYVYGKGENYFFSIYDVYKEVLVESIALVLLACFSLKMLCEEKITLRRIVVYIPLGCFFIMMLISFTQMINYYEGFIFLQRWMSYYVIFFIVANMCKTNESVQYYLNWFVCMGTILSLYGIVQICGIDFPFLVQNFHGNATDGNPNFMGQYMGMLFPLSLWIAFSYVGLKRAVFYLVCAFIMGFFIVMNKTKAVWVGLSVSVVFLCVYCVGMYCMGMFRFAITAKQKTIIKEVARTIGIIVVCVGVFSLLTFIPAVKKSHKIITTYNIRFMQVVTEFSQFSTSGYLFTPESEISEDEIVRGDTTMQRVLIWQHTIQLIKANPFLGVGLGNFKIAYQPYRTKKEQIATGPDVFVRRTHNEWLQFWSELGPIGFLFFLLIQFTLYLMIHRIVRRSVNFRVQCLSLGFMMSFAAIFVAAAFEFALQNPNPSFTLWVLVGLFSAYYWLAWCERGLKEVPVRCRGYVTSPLGRVLSRGQGSDDGVYVIAGKAKLWLAPVLIVCIIAGCVLHPVVWKPATAFYNRQFGQALQKMGLHKKSAILFERSLRDDPYAWETIFLLANEYAEMKRYDDAVREHERSLALNPYHSKGHYNLANTLNKLQRFREARFHYEEAIKYDYMLYQAYCNLGAICFQAKEYETSIEYYKKSLEMNPEFFSAYYNLAYALTGLGRIGEAVPYLREAKKLNPRNIKVLKLEEHIRKLIAAYNRRMQEQQAAATKNKQSV